MSALAAALSAAAPLLAQNPQRPTFKSSTELVVIDAQVSSRDVAPVEGLKAEQFEVFIDGKLRPIVSADFVRAVAKPGGVAP